MRKAPRGSSRSTKRTKSPCRSSVIDLAELLLVVEVGQVDDLLEIIGFGELADDLLILSPIWETPELALDLIEEFLTGVRRPAQASRVLATVLFTDIVGSTEQAGRLGDRRWRELLDVHDELARRLVEEFHGRLIHTTGDGILATFDGPGRAI